MTARIASTPRECDYAQVSSISLRLTRTPSQCSPCVNILQPSHTPYECVAPPQAARTALREAHTFFAKPDEEKSERAGYTRVSDVKETCPAHDAGPSHGQSQGAHKPLDALGRILLTSLARSAALGMRSDTLTPLLDAAPQSSVSPSRVDLFRYSAWEAGLPTYGAVGHVDKGLLTVIFADVPGGLQIQTVWLTHPDTALQHTPVLSVPNAE